MSQQIQQVYLVFLNALFDMFQHQIDHRHILHRTRVVQLPFDLGIRLINKLVDEVQTTGTYHLDVLLYFL